jgi:hypothetical protein
VTLIFIVIPTSCVVKALLIALTSFTKMLGDYILNVLNFMTMFVPMRIKLLHY